jgi:transcriptional regulator with XRE-family HTH domain
MRNPSAGVKPLMARELLEGEHAMSHRTPSMHPNVCDREPDGAGFGARLRRERERQNLSIATVAQRTKILGALIEGLENDDLSRWPVGFYRRGFFRAYALAVGLDPEPLLREFLRRFPDPEDVAAAAAATADANPARTTHTPVVRLTLAQEQSWFKRGRALRGIPLRCAVVAFDLVVLACIAVTGFAVIDMFWAPLAMAAMLYYGGGIVVLGNTPGVYLYGSTSVMTPELPLVLDRDGRPAPEDPAWRVGAESPIRV